jgi:hypothetical protein
MKPNNNLFLIIVNRCYDSACEVDTNLPLLLYFSGRNSAVVSPDSNHDNAAPLRPTEPQRRYLERGLMQPGGKLPLFDRDGREVPPRTIQSCVAHGWAEPWIHNPIRPEWQVCKLTAKGYAALGHEAGDSAGGAAPGATASDVKNG